MPLRILEDVRAALLNGRPVVGLETAVLTHGLPKDAGLKALRRQQAAISGAGAWPAVVGVWDGALSVGLAADQWEALAEFEGAAKVSPWNLAAACRDPGAGGTTVATTVRAAALAGIEVIATGGVGGVHPGCLDVSADLEEIARRPVVVVCSGPKSILDVAATMERLESLGVPVIGWRCERVPGFLAAMTEVAVTARADTLDGLTSLCRDHRAMSGGGVLVVQPVPASAAISGEELQQRNPVAAERQTGGGGRTPAELRALQERLGARAIDANLALLEANARLAGELATTLRTA